MNFLASFVVFTYATGLGAQVSFQSHYISLDTQDSSVAILADAGGEIFIVSAHNSTTRVTKTDPSGKVIGVLDLVQKVSPSAAAIDSQGNILIAGRGLIVKLDNALNLLATSPLGGSAITTDASGNVWVAGQSIGDPGGATFAAVSELSPDLSQIVHTTVYGGSGADCNPVSANCRRPNGPGLPATTMPTSIAIAPTGEVLIAGSTNGTPAKLGVEPYDYAFVAKFSADLSALEAQAIYNPNPDTTTGYRALAIDAQGSVLLAGGSAGSPGGGILMKLDSNLNPLWGPAFIASANHDISGLAFDAAGNIWITGLTNNAPFIAELTFNGSTTLNLINSQFGGAAVTALPNGGIAVLGTTDSFLLTASPDKPSLLLVANSANNQSSGTIAPAELISLYGANIGPAVAAGGIVAGGAFTNTLAGYQVLFNGIPAPLLYAGPNQMNVVAPVTIAGQQSVDIQVIGPNSSTVFPTVFVGRVRPQIFAQQSFAIAYNQDGTLNTPSNPLPKGSIATIWVSGAGLAVNPLPDGAIDPSASPLAVPPAMKDLELTYAGQAPGAIQGLTQINFRIPADAFIFGPTLWPLTVQQGSATSASANIEVTTN